MTNHVLSVTDGNSTLVLTADPWFLTDYTMSYPQRSSTGEYEPIAETIELHVSGSGSTTAVQTRVNALEVYLQRARQRQETGSGAKIYLQIKIANEEYTWRSELLEGEVEIQTDTLKAWGQAFALIRVHVMRRHFWEGAETLARFVQQYTGQGTTEVSVSNFTSTASGNQTRNFIEFSSTQIQGVLPTPAIIRQSNTSGSAPSRSYTEMQIALGKFREPHNFQHMYEGESASGAGSVITDASSANGRHRRIATSSTTQLCAWSMRVRSEFTERTYRVIGRFSSYTGPSNIYVRPLISYQTGAADIWVGEEVLLPVSSTASSFVDLGVVPIPLLPIRSTVGVMQIKLSFRSLSAGTINLDYIQLTPTDGYRILRPASILVAKNSAIIDNGVDELSYLGTPIIPGELLDDLDSGVDLYSPLDAGTGDYIHLYPGIGQRLYFLRTRTDGAPISDALNVKVYYRPRRLTI